MQKIGFHFSLALAVLLFLMSSLFLIISALFY